MSHTKLVQTGSERLQPLGTSEVDPSFGEHPIDRRVEGDELEVGQTVDELLEGHRAVIGFERLRRPDPRQRSASGARAADPGLRDQVAVPRVAHCLHGRLPRSEEHTSELQSLMRISYAVFCLKKKTQTVNKYHDNRPN